jgi:putative sporulation protein YtaF
MVIADRRDTMLLPVFSLAVLALAVSLDGFGVGVMYGLRKIRIPVISISIIALCSGIVIFGSMQLGVLLLQFLPPVYTREIGALILIIIGLWSLFQMIMQKYGDTADTENTVAGEMNPVVYIELKTLGLIIQILKSPSAADIDRSGNISASEAALLGIALSLDALGAGIGAALIGFNPLLTACMIALSSGIFLFFGLRLGFAFSGIHWVRRLSFLPGCILIMMGIIKMF